MQQGPQACPDLARLGHHGDCGRMDELSNRLSGRQTSLASGGECWKAADGETG